MPRITIVLLISDYRTLMTMRIRMAPILVTQRKLPGRGRPVVTVRVGMVRIGRVRGVMMARLGE